MRNVVARVRPTASGESPAPSAHPGADVSDDQGQDERRDRRSGEPTSTSRQVASDRDGGHASADDRHRERDVDHLGDGPERPPEQVIETGELLPAELRRPRLHLEKSQP